MCGLEGVSVSSCVLCQQHVLLAHMQATWHAYYLVGDGRVHGADGE
jgi:hypothetical protein